MAHATESEYDRLFLELGLEGGVHPLLPEDYWRKTHVIDFKDPRFGKTSQHYRDISELKLDYVKLPHQYVNQRGQKHHLHQWQMKGKLQGTNVLIPVVTAEYGAQTGIQGRYRGLSVTKNVHMGLDFFTKAGVSVYAPLEGTVFVVDDETVGGAPDDPYSGRGAGDYAYGPMIVLKHEAGGRRFYTLYGHLSRDSLGKWREGDRVAKGEVIGRIGGSHENGFWQPHVHFQVLTSPEKAFRGNRIADMHPSDIDAEALKLYPNPALLFPKAHWFREIEERNEFRIHGIRAAFKRWLTRRAPGLK